MSIFRIRTELCLLLCVISRSLHACRLCICRLRFRSLLCIGALVNKVTIAAAGQSHACKCLGIGTVRGLLLLVRGSCIHYGTLSLNIRAFMRLRSLKLCRGIYLVSHLLRHIQKQLLLLGGHRLTGCLLRVDCVNQCLVLTCGILNIFFVLRFRRRVNCITFLLGHIEKLLTLTFCQSCAAFLLCIDGGNQRLVLLCGKGDISIVLCLRRSINRRSLLLRHVKQLLSLALCQSLTGFLLFCNRGYKIAVFALRGFHVSLKLLLGIGVNSVLLFLTHVEQCLLGVIGHLRAKRLLRIDCRDEILILLRRIAKIRGKLCLGVTVSEALQVVCRRARQILLIFRLCQCGLALLLNGGKRLLGLLVIILGLLGVYVLIDRILLVNVILKAFHVKLIATLRSVTAVACISSVHSWFLCASGVTDRGTTCDTTRTVFRIRHAAGTGLRSCSS